MLVNGEGDPLHLQGVFIHQVILASRTGFCHSKRLLLSRSGECPHQGQNSWCGKPNFYKPQLCKHRGESVNSESSKNSYPRWNQGLAWEFDFKFCNAFRIHHPLVIRFRNRFQEVILTQFSVLNELSHVWIYTDPAQRGRLLAERRCSICRVKGSVQDD